MCLKNTIINYQFNISLLFCLSLLLTACEKVISIETIDIPRKLVVNGANQPEAPWQIHISNSANLTDEFGPASLGNALLLLQDETLGLIDTLPYLSDGYYGNGQMPLSGHQYFLTVQADDFTTVSGRGFIPTVPQFDSLSASYDEYRNDTVLLVNLYFEEEALVNNFYLINAVTTIYPNTSAEESQAALIYTLDKNTDNLDLGDESTPFRYIYINDENIFSPDYFPQFYVDLSNINDQNTPFCLSITLQSVSESLYLHLKSYEQYYDNSNGSSNFPTQVQVYSNIEEGFGIFGGYAIQQKEICF